MVFSPIGSSGCLTSLRRLESSEASGVDRSQSPRYPAAIIEAIPPAGYSAARDTVGVVTSNLERKSWSPLVNLQGTPSSARAEADLQVLLNMRAERVAQHVRARAAEPRLPQGETLACPRSAARIWTPRRAICLRATSRTVPRHRARLSDLCATRAAPQARKGERCGRACAARWPAVRAGRTGPCKSTRRSSRPISTFATRTLPALRVIAISSKSTMKPVAPVRTTRRFTSRFR
jgi:hypothetical protein